MGYFVSRATQPDLHLPILREANNRPYKIIFAPSILLLPFSLVLLCLEIFPKMSSTPNILWNDPQIVAGYRCIERITGPIGKLLIKNSGVASSKEDPLVILDNACGTGVISAALYEQLDDAKKAKLQLTCGDITSGMIEYMQHVIATNKWAGAKAQYVDAQVNLSQMVTDFL